MRHAEFETNADEDAERRRGIAILPNGQRLGRLLKAYRSYSKLIVCNLRNPWWRRWLNEFPAFTNYCIEILETKLFRLKYGFILAKHSKKCPRSTARFLHIVS